MSCFEVWYHLCFLVKFPTCVIGLPTVMFSTCVSWFSSTTCLSASFPEESPTVWLNFWICPPSLTMILYLYLIFAFLVYRFWTKWKTLIYSNTHPVPVCPSLRVLCLIENTSKQLWRKNLWGDHKSQSKWQFPSEVCEASVLSCKKSVLVPWKSYSYLNDALNACLSCAVHSYKNNKSGWFLHSSLDHDIREWQSRNLLLLAQNKHPRTVWLNQGFTPWWKYVKRDNKHLSVFCHKSTLCPNENLDAFECSIPAITKLLNRLQLWTTAAPDVKVLAGHRGQFSLFFMVRGLRRRESLLGECQCCLLWFHT